MKKTKTTKMRDLPTRKDPKAGAIDAFLDFTKTTPSPPPSEQKRP